MKIGTYALDEKPIFPLVYTLDFPTPPQNTNLRHIPKAYPNIQNFN